MNKRGQVTIFIVIAIVVIALGALFYLISPNLGINFSGRMENPNDFIATCLEDEFQDTVETVSMQGGSLNPTNYYVYNDYPVAYLCYTSENYHSCTLQKIAVEKEVEEDVKNQISPTIHSCFNSLKESYEKKGYIVSIIPGEIKVDLIPKKIVTSINYKLTLDKGSTETYDGFGIILNNNLYELIKIGQYIAEWERIYGGVDPFIIMNRYHFLDLDKDEREEGTTIYTLRDKSVGGEFQLATRSYVFPPGV